MSRKNNSDRKHNDAAKVWSLNFVLIIAIAFFLFFTTQGINAGTAVFLSVKGLEVTLAGVGMGCFSVASAITRLTCGAIIDRFRRAPLIILGCLILTLATLGIVFINRGVTFIIWRIFQGIGFAMASTVVATAATDVLPKSRLGEGLGYYGLGQALAFSVGPAAALFLVGLDPAENLYFGLSVSAFLAFICAILCRYERKPEKLSHTSQFYLAWKKRQDELAEKADEPKSLPNKKAEHAKGRFKRMLSDIFEGRALAGALPQFLIAPSFGFGITFIGLFGSTLGVENTGLFYTIAAIVMIVLRLFSRAFMDKILPIRIIGVAISGGIIGYILLLLCALNGLSALTTALFYIAGIFYGLMLSVAIPINQTVAVRNTPPERWGAANALFYLFNDLGIGLAAMLWGFTNDSFGFPVTICFVICFLIVGFIACCIFYPYEAKHAKKRNRK